ncbi:MAG: hypothetical protein ACREGA_01140 [Candidatus Saccharimonadales bacterium]
MVGKTPQVKLAGSNYQKLPAKNKLLILNQELLSLAQQSGVKLPR